MYSNYVHEIRKQVFTNTKYSKWVSKFSMNYSLLEALWTDIEEIGDIDNFCKRFCYYYWPLQQIKEKSQLFASIECVGSSKINRYRNEQTETIAQATSFLRYSVDLFNDYNLPECDTINCYHRKKVKNICNKSSAKNWARRSDHKDNIAYASFKALMYIIRQIRNNLFHGNKFDTEEQQLARNIVLVKNASKTVEFILDHLNRVENLESRLNYLCSQRQQSFIYTNLDLTGKWMLTENYEDGLIMADINIVQEHSELKGNMIITDEPENEEKFVIEESVVGFVHNEKISLSGTEVKLINGNLAINEYMLDQWWGVIIDENTIQGFSMDEDDTDGEFSIKRIVT